MYWNLFAIERTRIFKRKLLWVSMTLMVLLVLFAYLAIYISLKNPSGGNVVLAEARAQLLEMMTWPGALTNLLGIAAGNSLGGLFIIVLVGAVTAQEYTWRTFHLWLSRGSSRPVLLMAKFTALLIPAVLFVFAALVAGGAISALFSVQLNGTLHLEQVNFWQLVLSMARTTYTLLPYCALSFLLAIASRSTVVAIGGGLAYALMAESLMMQVIGLLGGTLGRLAQYLPAALADKLLNLHTANAAPAGEIQTAAVGIAVWTVLLVALSLWIFQRQDLTE